MDLSKMFGAASAIPGASKLLGNLAGLGDLAALKAKAAQKLGVSPAVLDEFEAEAKTLLADGKLTPQEMETELVKLAQKKGIPPQAIQMAMQLMRAQMGGK
jgi:hypothetical protein